MPVENGSARLHLSDLQIEVPCDDRQRLADTVAGQAPVKRIQLFDQAIKIKRWLAARSRSIIA